MAYGLRKMLTLSKSGTLSIEDFAHWLQQQITVADDLFVCSEPFFLCPLLDLSRARLIGVFNMALLNEFLFPDEASLNHWWSYWLTFRSHQFEVAIACRLTQHQVYAQTGEMFPYVPFVAIHINVQPKEWRDDVLLFRNNRQALLSFRMALHAVDRDVPRKTFRPIFVPDATLAQKYVWANRNYCGYDAEIQYRHVFREPANPAPYTPMFYYQWSIHAQWEHRRYWYQFTEWATLPGLLPFSSIHDLLQQIDTLDTHDDIRQTMQRHHVKASADVLHWWTRAIATTFV
eukprot:GEMP01033391.1.p1 GENE.GEMP01033391.1~~GEMP01033391.1.p1  ORF type:complete len:288 (+),score=50.37 GEMP01033391.1:657-1520(+)